MKNKYETVERDLFLTRGNITVVGQGLIQVSLLKISFWYHSFKNLLILFYVKRIRFEKISLNVNV